MRKTILITGSSSLLGMSLLRYLQRVEDKVLIKAVYYEKMPFYFKTPDNVEWINASLNDTAKVINVVKNVDLVYHCAGFTSFESAYNQKLVESNESLTRNIVNACLNHSISKLVYVSSCAFLIPGGNTTYSMINETINENKISFRKSAYHESKFLAEMEAWRGIHQGLDTVIINPSIVIGTSKWMRDYNSILYNFVKRNSYYPTGSFGFVGSQDVAEIMHRLMNSNIKNERFIVSAENKTFQEICQIVKPLITSKQTFTLKPLTPKKERILRLFFHIRKFLPFASNKISPDLIDFFQESKQFDNSKLLQAIPNFKYTPIKECFQQTVENRGNPI